MIRGVFIALVLLLFFQYHSFAQDDGSFIRIGIFQNYPIVFIDDDGLPQGLYVDLIWEIANREEWDIQFVPGTWSEGLERLRSAEIDLMTSIAYLDERDVYMDFSHENVLTMWGQVYVTQDSDIQNIFDLQGETVAILKGGVNGINFMAMIDKFDVQCEFRVVDSYAEVAELVASGNASAGVINNIHGYEQEKQYSIIRSPIIFNPFSLLFAVPEGKNQHLLETIDSYLTKWKSDPKSPYYSNITKWFGLEEKEALPDWVFRTLLIGGGLLLSIAVWVIILRQQVKVRTIELTESRERLRNYSDQLEEMVGDLERSNTDLTQFAYVASHDLQEPLRMIASYIQLLEQRYGGQLDDDADEFIAYAVDGAKRLQMLINSLLEYTRVGTRGRALAPTNSEKVLDRTLRNLGKLIKESGTSVTHDQLPTVMADEVQLEQVFQNLLGNAIKFHSEVPPEIHIGVERMDGEWKFSIRDNGIGIEAEYRERIFVIFKRLHTGEEYPGTGIGLAISKRIIERHGGRIWVETTPGGGSTFFFTLPVREE